MKVEEQQILALLKNPPESKEQPFDSQDNAEMDGIEKGQEKLSKETRDVAGEMSKLAEETALIGPEAGDSMREAHKEMKSAEKALSGRQSEQAQQHQQKALSHLRKGQEGLQSMKQRLEQSMKMGGGKNMGSIQPRNEAGGRSGFRNGIVEIPGAQDYLPPREFREELLESLKEKYPKSQESVIKDYYKKLSQ